MVHVYNSISVMSLIHLERVTGGLHLIMFTIFSKNNYKVNGDKQNSHALSGKFMLIVFCSFSLPKELLLQQ